ncbi:MAG: EAL domain-containing protein [Aquificota bacterium]|nr:MAG: EAL domain-containing protein [Aquificota bacterium]
MLNRLTEEYNIKRENIVIELTERESLKNISIIKEFTNSLKQEGYLFAIDDFGSGYSTFKYLKEFPVDIVKIDGEFIKGMLNSEKDKIFVKSLIDLAKGMGLKVLAEFVENERIFNMVRELNVDFAQGYYIGKPSPTLKLNNGRSDRT